MTDNDEGGDGERLCMTQFDSIHILELIQARDTFLVRYRCPVCHAENISGVRCVVCEECKLDFTRNPLLPPKQKIRLLAGSVRKQNKRLNKKLIYSLLEVQDRKCAYCNSYLESDYNLEHITPISFGGTNNFSNLCISCPQCNSAASNFVFTDFLAKRDFILNKRKRMHK